MRNENWGLDYVANLLLPGRPHLWQKTALQRFFVEENDQNRSPAVLIIRNENYNQMLHALKWKYWPIKPLSSGFDVANISIPSARAFDYSSHFGDWAIDYPT